MPFTDKDFELKSVLIIVTTTTCAFIRSKGENINNIFI